MRKIFQAIGCTFFSLALLLGLLSGVILAVAGSPNYMNSMFLRHADPAITGVDVQEYNGLAEKITAYLTGSADTFQTTLLVHGQMREAFSEKELLHMKDVRALFSLCRSVFLFCLLIVIIFLALSLFCFRPMLAFLARCYIRISLFIAALGTALSVWAAVDFISLFTLFHHLFFTNDLWLLNPKQDLLLQLMPTSFFVGYAARIGLNWLLGAALFFVSAILYLKRRKRQA
jgi:integral membrane protein (TIGR01906 family)